MKQNERVYFDAIWWRANKAKTLNDGGVVERALAEYQDACAFDAGADADGLTKKTSRLITALREVGKAVNAAIAKTDFRHRETLEVLKQYQTWVQQKLERAESVKYVETALGLMALRIRQTGPQEWFTTQQIRAKGSPPVLPFRKRDLEKLTSEQIGKLGELEAKEGIIAYIMYLISGNEQRKREFLWAVTSKLNQLLSTQVELLEDAIHAQNPNARAVAYGEGTAFKAKWAIEESLRQLASVNPRSTGSDITTRLLNVKVKLESVASDANRSRTEVLKTLEQTLLAA